MQYTITIKRTYTTTINVEADNLTEANQLLDDIVSSGDFATLELEQMNITEESYAVRPSSDFKRTLVTTYQDGQQVYEGDKFVNQCDITGEGMNEGWIVGEGDMYIKYESDAIKYCKDTFNMTLQEAYDNELMYWTEWDIVSCDEFCYKIKDGQLIEIEF